MAEDEEERIRTSITQLEEELIESVEIDSLDGCREGVIEIRPGTGGEEAGFFAKEMYDMYCNALSSMDITFEQRRPDTDFKIRFEGNTAMKYIRYEAGVHRVQRVPVTDSKGRVHTSTVSVVVLPAKMPNSVVINPRDLKFESFRSSGPGGQNANVSNSAVRVTHIPTGISICNQEERSNSVNREKAITALTERLQELEDEKASANVTQLRRQQVKIAHRSEKIRTYNVCQNRVTDHVITGINYAFDSFMTGKALPALLRQRRAQHVSEWLIGQGQYI